MMLGQADTIRVSLLYITGQMSTPVIENLGNIAVAASPIPIGTPGPLARSFGSEYEVLIVAHLNAPGFDVLPNTDQEYHLSDTRRLDWVWDVLPNKEGPQALSLTIDARWEHNGSGKIFTYPLYRQRLLTAVDVPIFTWGSPLQIYTILGALSGALITWVAPRLYARLSISDNERHKPDSNRAKRVRRTVRRD